MTTPAPGQAEGNQTDAGAPGTGSPVDASPGGSAGEGTPTPEPGSWEARARGWQSQADQYRAQVQTLQQQLAGTTGAPAVEAPQAGGGAAPLTVADFVAAMDARESMRDMRAAIVSEFGESNIHPEILRQYADYESPEALYTAAQQYAQGVQSLREQIREEEAAKLRGEAGGRQGDRPPVTNHQAAGGGGQPSPDQIARMSQSEFEALDPAYVNSILVANG